MVVSGVDPVSRTPPGRGGMECHDAEEPSAVPGGMSRTYHRSGVEGTDA